MGFEAVQKRAVDVLGNISAFIAGPTVALSTIV
jgi:hypothetical protein